MYWCDYCNLKQGNRSGIFFRSRKIVTVILFENVKRRNSSILNISEVIHNECSLTKNNFGYYHAGCLSTTRDVVCAVS